METKKVTAIFGVNGCGKSTILHALALFDIDLVVLIGEKNYFTRFFKRENRVTWIGSKLYADLPLKVLLEMVIDMKRGETAGLLV